MERDVKPKSSGRQMTDAERKFEEIQRKRVSRTLDCWVRPRMDS